METINKMICYRDIDLISKLRPYICETHFAIVVVVGTARPYFYLYFILLYNGLVLYA